MQIEFQFCSPIPGCMNIVFLNKTKFWKIPTSPYPQFKCKRKKLKNIATFKVTLHGRNIEARILFSRLLTNRAIEKSLEKK